MSGFWRKRRGEDVKSVYGWTELFYIYGDAGLKIRVGVISRAHVSLSLISGYSWDLLYSSDVSFVSFSSF